MSPILLDLDLNLICGDCPPGDRTLIFFRTELRALVRGRYRPMSLEPNDITHLRLASIVASADDAIISTDLSGTITSWNRAAERIFGYTEAEAIGQSIRLIVPPELYEEEDDVLRRVRAGEGVDHFETVRIRKDGQRIDVSLTVSPIVTPDGQVIGASTDCARHHRTPTARAGRAPFRRHRRIERRRDHQQGSERDDPCRGTVPPNGSLVTRRPR